MNKTLCPNQDCKSVNSIEINNSSVSGYPYPVPLVQCKKCGTVIGTQLLPAIVEDMKRLLEHLQPKN